MGFALSEQIIGRSLGWAMLGWALAAMHTMMIFFGALGLKWWAQNFLRDQNGLSTQSEGFWNECERGGCGTQMGCRHTVG